MIKVNIRKALAAALAVLLILTLAACSGEGPDEADVTDETVFSPPEEDGSLAGIWNAETDELTIDRYFYGSGQLVTIIQDPEEETWCILSLWSEDDKDIKIENKDEYVYDTSDGKWEKSDNLSVGDMVEAKQTGDDTFTANETLPNDTTAETEFKRGESNIEIPNDAEISLEINNFLMH